MKISQYLLDKTNGEQKIFLDVGDKKCIVYVTNHGLQILNLEPVLSDEEIKEAFKFAEEFLQTIENTNEPEQPVIQCGGEASNSETKEPESASESPEQRPT